MNIKRIEIPEVFQNLDDFVFVVNVSTGKDSTAAELAMKEAGIPHVRVFADTGWEDDATYEHLELLKQLLGPIEVVGHPGGMVDKIRRGARFASRMARWCTTELKVEPLRTFYDKIERETMKSAVCVTGIRSDESEARSAYPEIEDDPGWGGWMWRVILKWSIEDVLAIHHRHGVPVNPLYKRGHNRVGCYPCVMSTKEDIRLVAEHSPRRIGLIRDLEQEATEERIRRNKIEPGRYSHEKATFFLTVDRGRETPMGIDEIVTWARTDRGGRQLPMFSKTPDQGCFKWGLCDAPVSDRSDTDISRSDSGSPSPNRSGS